MSKGTTLRSVRVADDLWLEAQKEAGQAGGNLSDVIRKALAEYITQQRALRKPGRP